MPHKSLTFDKSDVLLYASTKQVSGDGMVVVDFVDFSPTHSQTPSLHRLNVESNQESSVETAETEATQIHSTKRLSALPW